MILGKIRAKLLILGDIAVLYLSLFLTLLFRYGLSNIWEQWDKHFYPFTLIFLIWLVVFYLFDLYDPRAFKNRLELSGLWSLSVLISFLASIATFYVFISFFTITPKTNLIIFALSFGILGFIWRATLLSVFKSTKWVTKFLILGDSQNLRDLVNMIEKNPAIGYQKEYWIKEAPSDTQVLEIINMAKENKIEMVAIHPSLMKNISVTSLSYNLLSYGITIRDFTDFYEEIFRKMPLEDLEESWFVREIKMSQKIILQK